MCTFILSTSIQILCSSSFTWIIKSSYTNSIYMQTCFLCRIFLIFSFAFVSYFFMFHNFFLSLSLSWFNIFVFFSFFLSKTRTKKELLIKANIGNIHEETASVRALYATLILISFSRALMLTLP
jgi:hypothetical protein